MNCKRVCFSSEGLTLPSSSPLMWYLFHNNGILENEHITREKKVKESMLLGMRHALYLHRMSLRVFG